jgi:hypothetical protein
MKKGRLPNPQKQRYVSEIRDVDLFGDGLRYTLYVLEEDLIRTPAGFYRLIPNARVVEVKLEEAQEQYVEVRIPNDALRRIRKRFSRRRGAAD